MPPPGSDSEGRLPPAAGRAKCGGPGTWGQAGEERDAEPWTEAWSSSSLGRRKLLEEETAEGGTLTPFSVLSVTAAGAEPPRPGTAHSLHLH